MHGLDALRCPWCHDAILGDDEVVVCRDCLAAHHEACWAEAACCATCGRSRGLTGESPRGPRPAAASWVRALAGIAATYLVSGPAAGVVGLGLELLGARSPTTQPFYGWCFFSCLFLFMGLLGAGGVWAVLRLGELALGERPDRRLLRRTSPRDRRRARTCRTASEGGKRVEADATLRA